MYINPSDILEIPLIVVVTFIYSLVSRNIKDSYLMRSVLHVSYITRTEAFFSSIQSREFTNIGQRHTAVVVYYDKFINSTTSLAAAGRQ